MQEEQLVLERGREEIKFRRHQVGLRLQQQQLQQQQEQELRLKWQQQEHKLGLRQQERARKQKKEIWTLRRAKVKGNWTDRMNFKIIWVTGRRLRKRWIKTQAGKNCRLDKLSGPTVWP